MITSRERFLALWKFVAVQDGDAMAWSRELHLGLTGWGGWRKEAWGLRFVACGEAVFSNGLVRGRVLCPARIWDMFRFWLCYLIRKPVRCILAGKLTREFIRLF